MKIFVNTIVVAAIATVSLLGMAVIPASAQIVNGNFEAGDTGFASDYTDRTGQSNTSEGQYSILTDPHDFNAGFTSFHDHTSNGGLMLVVNGAVTPNLDFWRQSVSLAPGSAVTVSAWVGSAVPSGPAVVQFFVNGSAIGTPLIASSSAGGWQELSTTFFSGAGGPITLSLRDNNLAEFPNDFTVDDITLRQITVAPDANPAVLMLLGTVFGFRRQSGKIRKNR